MSDGSTDRTAEFAGQYSGQIDLIVLPQNGGYGAAIKEAWRRYLHYRDSAHMMPADPTPIGDADPRPVEPDPPDRVRARPAHEG